MTVTKGRRIIVYFLCALFILGQGVCLDVSSSADSGDIYWFRPLHRPLKVEGVNPGIGKVPFKQTRIVAQLPEGGGVYDKDCLVQTGEHLGSTGRQYRAGISLNTNVIPFVTDKNCFYLII
ncbi:MAG: hypothetical protein E7416_05210 [Ruminococcaceae bacterium]|nr:hypothetical protein [Oscillospiraceae bacterium]